MANFEFQPPEQADLAQSEGAKPNLRSIFTSREEQAIWCAITSMTVAADRRNNGMTGQELGDFHKQMLTDRCGNIDLSKWVAEDEANREANHRAIEALKALEKK